MMTNEYIVGNPIEYTDPIDENVYKGVIIFIEEFAGKLLVYIRFEEEKRNTHIDPRFAVSYGQILPIDIE